MKKITILLTILIAMTSNAQESNVKNAFLEKWDNSKVYLAAIAEAMPEDKYDFKPTESQMSFQEQLVHINANMTWLGSTYFEAEIDDASREEIKFLPKEELIAILNQRFSEIYDAVKQMDEERFKEEVEFFAGTKYRLQILNLLQDHVTHHRGQLVVYLNLCEAELPKYVGW